MEKLFYLAGVTLFSGIAITISQLLTRKQSVTVNEVLLYGASKEKTRKELGLNNIFCIYYVLTHASLTIDVCMPSLDSDTISKCLIKIHQNNKVKVRIVVHKNPVSNLKVFLDCGVEVKVTRNPEVVLEHEFILIDAIGDCEEALTIMGSIDYEVESVNCNSDNTILTSDKEIVCTFKREFDRIWNSSVNAE